MLVGGADTAVYDIPSPDETREASDVSSVAVHWPPTPRQAVIAISIHAAADAPGTREPVNRAFSLRLFPCARSCVPASASIDGQRHRRGAGREARGD